MTITATRRTMGAAAMASLLLGSLGTSAQAAKSGYFGQINRFRTKPGRVDELRHELRLMVSALTTVDRYDVLRDDRDPATFWTVEIWPSQATHDLAVSAPEIRAGIDRCRLLITEFQNVATFTIPAGPAT